METFSHVSPAPRTDPLRLLATAPHRLLFSAGASAVLLSMLWWALWLGNTRFGWGFVPQPPVPPGWAHAMLTQYGMLPLFIFGFLLTVFPRWMGQAALSTTRYVPVAVGILAGYVLAHMGLLGSKALLVTGLVLMLLGYLAGLHALAGVLWRNHLRDYWGLSTWCALALGALALTMFIAFMLGADSRWGLAAVKLGTFGVLLPVYFTVCHRMIPFFSNNAAKNYLVRRPTWSLPLVWLLLLAHLTLAWLAASKWLCWVDLSLAVFFVWHWLAWQPWKCLHTGLLTALYLAFAWLPLAFILYTMQDVMLAWQGQSVLGLAPLHALTIGFFGSMLVAMVTRVTMGHSGRPLVMGRVAWLCFALLQWVALLRIAAALSNDIYFWSAIAAFGWLLAFTPWVVQSLKIYLTPRVDGRSV